jgi:hypothetical protein
MIKPLIGVCLALAPLGSVVGAQEAEDRSLGNLETQVSQEHRGAPRPGKRPAVVGLSGQTGGEVRDGSPWTSASLKDAVSMLVYVDPDEKDLNEDLAKRLKAEKFDHQYFKSVAIINMKATWKPNAILNAMLKRKQESYPDTLYVKDYDSVLVKEWGLADQTYDVLLFDREGQVLFRKDGKLSDQEIETFVSLVRDNLKDRSPRAEGPLDRVTL